MRKSKKGSWKNRKFTRKQVFAAIEGSAGVKTVVAKRLGCSRRGLDRYCADLPEVLKRLNEEKETIKDLCEAKIYDAIKKDNITMLIFFAKTQMKDRGYVEKQIIDQTSSDGTMSPSGAADLTDEELKEKLEEYGIIQP